MSAPALCRSRFASLLLFIGTGTVLLTSLSLTDFASIDPFALIGKAPVDSFTPELIFIHWRSNASEEIPWLAACSVRSAALTNPSWTVRVLVHPELPKLPRLWRGLSNLRVQTARPGDVFRDTRLEDWWLHEEQYPSNYPGMILVEHFSHKIKFIHPS